MELNWKAFHVAHMYIAPQTAAIWLQTRNNHNRHRRDTVGEQYARDMANGNWLESGDTLRFDWNGEIIDGQHRLGAIVDSGKGQYFIVITGLDPKVRTVVDTHAKRNTRDAFDGSGHAALLGDGSVSKNTAAGMWARIMHGILQKKGRETRQELVLFANRYPEGGLFSLEIFGQHKRVRQIYVAGVLAAVARAYYHYTDDVNLERLKSFAEAMATGIQKSPVDRMVIMWRETLREMRVGGNSNAQSEIYGKTARAIQGYMDGIALGKIYMPNEEPFPLPDRSSATADHSAGPLADIFATGTWGSRPDSLVAATHQ